jgi:UDPglucose 6-dehydrogenase
LQFTTDAGEAVRGARFVFVCVGTPATYSGDADLSAVWTVLDELRDPEAGSVLVMKSTVPVGTGDKVRAALDARGLQHVGYVSNPEFLAEGSAVRDFLHPDRIVVGSFDNADGDAVEALHAGLDAPVVRTDVPSAEMVKLAANAYLGTRISFINEIANVCELVGADVEQVAHGMGLDARIGTQYLQAGIGFGGSCLPGDETVLVRIRDQTRLLKLEDLFDQADEGEDIEIVSWRPDGTGVEFLPIAVLTRRPYEGDLIEVRTKMGRRVSCTPDHPFATKDGRKLAAELTTDDWLPVAQGVDPRLEPVEPLPSVLSGLASAGLVEENIIVRVEELEVLGVGAVRDSIAEVYRGKQRTYMRAWDVVRSGSLRLPEARALQLDVTEASFGTAKNGTYVPATIPSDEAFWRIVGLYIAEGHCSTDGLRRRLQWSFHPRDEADLVEEVRSFWTRLGVKADVRLRPTTTSVVVSSRILAGWWVDVLGLGRNCYEQRLPDAVWSLPATHKRALLSGLWQGDGSWSFVNRGPSVVLEYGTVSRELADGMLRLLGDLGFVARLKIGRTSKSTTDTYWLVISGADQIEQLLDFVPESSRGTIVASLGRLRRIAPTGYRRDDNAAWVRVTDFLRRRYLGYVYSLEVPPTHAFATTGGLVVSNCFPKDISFLKLLAGNSGYHFQLLNAVIEVNELQKRRVVSKLQKHLGSLRGKTIALLGLAFKPHTDDMREAPSIVLASRLLAEGADVRAWDPVADASQILRGVTFCDSVLDAVRDADAAVVVTGWDELRELASEDVREAMRTPLIVDGRNVVDPEQARRLGFTYEGIGRSASALETLPETDEPPVREPSQ